MPAITITNSGFVYLQYHIFYRLTSDVVFKPMRSANSGRISHMPRIEDSIYCSSFIERRPVLLVKQQMIISEPPFFGGGLRGNICDSSLARCKAESRLSIGYN